MHFLLSAFFLFPILPHAEGRDCLDSGEVKALNDKFQIQLQQAPNFCDNTNRTYNVMESLIFLSKLQLDSNRALSSPYDQKILGTDWIGYFSKIAPHIYWGPDQPPGNRCNNSFAYAFTNPANPNKEIYMCPLSFVNTSAEDSVLKITSTMLHESRHLVGDGFSHVACMNAPPSSQGCDQNISMQGAYATEVEALAKIGKALNVHPALRFYSKYLSYTTALSRFREPAVALSKIANAVMVRTEKNEVFALYEGGTVRRILKSYPPGRVFQVYGIGFFYFPFDTSKKALGISIKQLLGFRGQEDPAVTSNNLYIRYNAASAEERKQLLDVEMMLPQGGPTYAAAIWGNVITLSPNTPGAKDIEVKIPSGKPVRFTRLNIYSNVLFVWNDSNKLFQIFLPPHGAPTVSPTTQSVEYVRQIEMIASPGIKYGINAKGQLFQSTPQGTKPVPEFTDQKVIDVSSDFYFEPDWSEPLDD